MQGGGGGAGRHGEDGGRGRAGGGRDQPARQGLGWKYHQRSAGGNIISSKAKLKRLHLSNTNIQGEGSASTQNGSGVSPIPRVEAGAQHWKVLLSKRILIFDAYFPS